MSAFEPYLWQQAPMRRMQDAIDQERLPHAILFSGPKGIGKQHLASCLTYRALEKYTISPNFHTLLEADTHPDLLIIVPEEDKKLISVDQIRGLSKRISLTPHLSRIKIAVITPAESMTGAAANALLKTLEEPPGNTLIILVSHNHGRLPQTIRSRCQLLPLNMPDAQLAESWLRGQNISTPQAYLELAGGAPLTAQLAAENEWLEHHHHLMNDLLALFEHRVDMVSVSAKWRDFDAVLLINWIQDLIKAFIKSQLCKEMTSIMAANFLKNLKISLNGIDLTGLIDYLAFLDKSALEIDNNLNRELFLEQIFSRWARLRPA